MGKVCHADTCENTRKVRIENSFNYRYLNYFHTLIRDLFFEFSLEKHFKKFIARVKFFVSVWAVNHQHRKFACFVSQFFGNETWVSWKVNLKVVGLALQGENWQIFIYWNVLKETACSSFILLINSWLTLQRVLNKISEFFVSDEHKFSFDVQNLIVSSRYC